MTKRLGTLVAIDQATAACTRTKRNDAKSVSATQQLENIARMWNFQGHQTNFVRLAVAEVLSQGYTKTDVAKVIRLQHDDEWNGIVNNGTDKICKRIMATLVRIHSMAKSGALQDVSPTMSKTLKAGSRGNKKGAIRGPYKKRQSAESEAMSEQPVQNDTLPDLGEVNVEVIDVKMEEDQQKCHVEEDEEEQVNNTHEDEMQQQVNGNDVNNDEHMEVITPC
ncbi:hypothetical protein HJC23_010508 [Cyclotella cryptica]|uniref:Uncharacterized protein n=1 Tax=Cyclotella cryptica TaxID=29204 RepID=A0ABD3QAI4_9STRA|eukprot:CCRYP_007083-RA/>CCRYP_007083-RA protein AED:0.16 eAED:0.16 QI:693/1/1/1/0.5/0.42/7/2725/221